MGTLQLRPEFFDIYLELAVDFGLPLRLSGASTERLIGFPFRELAAREDVVFPDHFLYVNDGPGSRRTIERAIADLPPGVTEAYLHPATDTAELRAAMSDWPSRVDDLDLLTRDSELRCTLDRLGIQLIGYRELRDLQRNS
jgi:chitin disaccharide deacetylase